MALIKSSFVLLTPDLDLRISARNRLPGTVLRSIVRGAVNSEVKLQLTGDSDHGRHRHQREPAGTRAWRKRRACCAVINASHVLIAVND